MLTLKVITQETEKVLKGLEKKHFKNAKETIDKVLEYDKVRRASQGELDATLQQSKQLAAKIGQLMKEKNIAEAEEVKKQVAELKEKSKALEVAMEEAAGKYPDVVFSHGTGYKSNETNFNNYFGRIYQARYLAGIAAGLKSLESGNNNVGYVAAHTTDYAETASGINGFALGVQAVNPNAKIYVKNLNNWADEKNEKAYAEELINVYNCGVVSQHCDSAQPQIAAQNAGVFGCGYNSDMTPDAPQAHLTAAIWNWNVYYATAIKAAQECGEAKNFVTQMGGSAYYGGLKEGFVDVSPLSENCSAGTAQAIEKVKAMIISGEWDVFSGVKLQITVENGEATVEKVEAALETNGFEYKDGNFKSPMENVVVVEAGDPSAQAKQAPRRRLERTLCT